MLTEVIFAVPDTVILPVEELYTAVPVVAETVPPVMFTVPVESLRIAMPKLAAVFAMSARLVTETESRTSMVKDPDSVIFPVSVTMPHVEAPELENVMYDVLEPVSNTALPSPNCMAQSAPAASVLIALITSDILLLDVPTAAPPLAAVYLEPLLVMTYEGGGGSGSGSVVGPPGSGVGSFLQAARARAKIAANTISHNELCFS